jgi:hypothetical protein
MHGGTVEAYSDGIGCGSEFVIRLPLLDQQAAQRAAAARAASSDSRKLQVLVVDDNQDAADSLTALLELDGFEVRTVYDGGAAIAAVQRRRRHVIMDLGMPGMDGYETARALRRRRRTHPDAGPDRLGPGRRAPPHHGGRLRPPPGQAGGAGADHPPGRAADDRGLMPASAYFQSPRKAATRCFRSSGDTSCGATGPHRQRQARTQALAEHAFEHVILLAAQQMAPQAAQRHRNHRHLAALDDLGDAALEFIDVAGARELPSGKMHTSSPSCSACAIST